VQAHQGAVGGDSERGLAMATLLEKAMADSGRQVDVTDEEIDLAIAWAEGRITFSAAMRALGKPGSNGTYVRLSLGLKESVRKGILVRAKEGA
jgi:hypothetical protein